MATDISGPLVFRPAIVRGEHVVTSEEFMSFFIPHFASHLPGYDSDPEAAVNKARHIACSSMKIKHRYFCRPLETMAVPLTPQQKRDNFVKIGLEMSVAAVKKALSNAGLQSEDIACIIYVTHAPFPFPSFTANLMNELTFKKDCFQIPVNTLGCAAGAFALEMARVFLLSHPNENVLVLSLELCSPSIDFCPTHSGMDWFIHAALFGDAAAAFVVKGRESKKISSPNAVALSILKGKQMHIPNTAHIAYFTYDEWGYDFETTNELIQVFQKNCPKFVIDLSQEVFKKHPKEVALSLIHPGGSHLINDVGKALGLEGSTSQELALQSMADGGNISSASVIDMMDRAWDRLEGGEDLLVVGMGAGFILGGVAMVAEKMGM